MVTVKNSFNDINSWLEIQKLDFKPNEIKQFEQAIAIAEIYYNNNNFYPTDAPLITHALTCANKVAALHLYYDAVIATILFALPKYCENYAQELKIFDPKVQELIEGITKVTKIRRLGEYSDVKNKDDKREQIEIMRKMLLAMASDIRVVLIVLVGRGELMLNLKSSTDPEIIHKIALETTEIFAPLANRLGVWQIKWELEDLSFKYLHPEQYKKIAQLIDETREERLNYITQIKEFLSKEMKENGINTFELSGRAKHIYSIWRKMKKKNYDFGDLYDIRAVRVLVPEIRDCYTVLGIVHTKYSPIPGEFDDYISNPKANNYQSLHTCVIGPNQRVVEIQIRTYTMHDHAEYGIAAHWRYKEGGSNNPAFAEKIAWIRQILDWREDTIDKKDMANVFKNEIFSDTIYVLTPNAKVIALPEGSSPIDFAYAVHSDIGHRCRGAKVDGHIVPLATKLKNGQKVEILTIKAGGPSINWLHDGLVTSPKAISHIRRWIREQNNEHFFTIGHDIFERELAKYPLSIRPTNIDIVTSLGYENEKMLAIDLAKGEVLASSIRSIIERKLLKAQSLNLNSEPKPIIFSKAKIHALKPESILIEGVSGIVSHMAKCCKAVPGDKIIGFITQVNGVSVHRSNCASIKRQAKLFPYKVIQVSWGKEAELASFSSDIEIIANDRQGLVKELSDLINSEKLNIIALKTSIKNNKAIMLFTITLQVSNFNFTYLLNKILNLTGVLEANRK